MTTDNQNQDELDIAALASLEAVISLDSSHLVREIEQFTAAISLKGREMADAVRVAALMKLQCDRTEARLRLDMRHAAEMAGTKLTASDLDASVTSTDAYEAAKTEEINSAYARDTLKADVRALEAKERMLDLLGRREIAELRKDPQASVQSASSTYNSIG